MQQVSCAYCHQPIYGTVITALGTTWHSEHFLCAYCGKPIYEISFNTQDGRPYHSACYTAAIAPRCAYCGKPLTSEFLIDQWGTKFCKEHQGQYSQCDYCGRLLAPQQHEGGTPESIRCPVCRSTAIETTEEAQPLFKEGILWVSRQGLRYNQQRLSLELVDRGRLAQYLQTRGESDALGVAKSSIETLNGHVMRVIIDGIAVLHGLPASLFQSVTVHELGHVWLAVQGVHDLPTWAEEGFCELLSHRFDTDKNTPESLHHARNIERNPNSVYGEGYRRIRAIVDRHGFGRFIEGLSATKKLP